MAQCFGQSTGTEARTKTILFQLCSPQGLCRSIYWKRRRGRKRRVREHLPHQQGGWSSQSPRSLLWYLEGFLLKQKRKYALCFSRYKLRKSILCPTRLPSIPLPLQGVQGHSGPTYTYLPFGRPGLQEEAQGVLRNCQSVLNFELISYKTL